MTVSGLITRDPWQAAGTHSDIGGVTGRTAGQWGKKKKRHLLEERLDIWSNAGMVPGDQGHGTGLGVAAGPVTGKVWVESACFEDNAQNLIGPLVFTRQFLRNGGERLERDEKYHRHLVHIIKTFISSSWSSEFMSRAPR